MLDAAMSDRLIAFFGGLLDFYRDFLSLETDKYGDVAAGRLKELNARMTDEQAFVLKAKGFEQERLRLLREAGADTATLGELISLLPEDRRQTMRKVHSELSSTVNSLKRVNDSCQQLTKTKLRQTAKVLSGLEDHPELKRIYDPSSGDTTDPGGVFSIKI